MQIGEICIRDVVYVNRTASIQEASRLMRSQHVGDVIVIDESAHGKVPVGILTDRDIVVQVLAAGLDPVRLTAGDIMTFDLVTAPADQGIFETVNQMQHSGIRRLPVVDKFGVLVGVVSADDLLELFSMQLSSLAKVVSRARQHELQVRA